MDAGDRDGGLRGGRRDALGKYPKQRAHGMLRGRDHDGVAAVAAFADRGYERDPRQ